MYWDPLRMEINIMQCSKECDFAEGVHGRTPHRAVAKAMIDRGIVCEND